MSTDVSVATMSALTARLERTLDQLEPAAELLRHAPMAIATTVDTVDALIAEGKANGIDVDQRARDMLALLERLSAPETVRSLNLLLDRLPALTALIPMVDDAPAVMEQARKNARPVGLMGTLSALREPHVQQAVGLAISTARLVGQRVGTQGARAS
ncbi:MAG: DUF1641 domain-containing protein [Gemmatimonadaceae bacterium]|nr:DUF1641 domain-containing protein [Gemmatimonadaceae bacterium]